MKMEMQDSDFSRALALHQQGRLDQAIPLYQTFLRANRKHLGAANMLGVALMQTGRLEEAADAIGRALRLDPKQASAHYNLGTVLQALGRNNEAADHFRKTIALNPNDPQAFNNLGVALKALGEMEGASKAYRQATALRPDFAGAHANLAAALCVLERYEEALEATDRALALDPNLVEVLVTRGNALNGLDRPLEALPCFDRAIALAPDRPEAYLCAGNVLTLLQFEDRAVEFYQRVVLLKPKSANARFHLAICLHDLGRREEAKEEAARAFAIFDDVSADIDDQIALGYYLVKINKSDEAIVRFDKALAVDSKSVLALRGKAVALNLMQRTEEANRVFDLAIAARGTGGEAVRAEKAVAALAAGNFEEGWKLHAIRFSERVKGIAPREHRASWWHGEQVSGLLIWGEQGLGDQIIFASMIPDAAKRAERVVVELEPRLIPLFERSFPSAEFRPLGPEPYETGITAHTPIGGLGEHLRLRWEDFPRKAYLVADRSRAERLRGIIHADKKCVIGISWRSANQKFGEHKTAQLTDFAPMLQRPELGFVDLQYGETADELKEVREALGVAVQHVDEIDNKNDIDGLAALIEACDAVVTVSNTTAHIAGALGKPVWVLVPHGKGRIWYWFHNRSDSPWYPGARIVRQQRGQSWSDLAASIVPKISAFAAEKKSGG